MHVCTYIYLVHTLHENTLTDTSYQSVNSKLDDSLNHPLHVLHLGSSLSCAVQVGNAEVDVMKADHVVGSRLRNGRALAIGVGKVRHHVDRPVVRVCRNVEEPSRLFPILAIFLYGGGTGAGEGAVHEFFLHGSDGSYFGYVIFTALW